MLPDMTGFRAMYGPGTKAVCAYGGDGTLVRAWRSIDYDEALFPVRNYGLCPEHEKLYLRAAGGADLRGLGFLKTALGLVRMRLKGRELRALSELQLRAACPTFAMRFGVSLDGDEVARNVIADGVICATAKVGATGYWNSLTRTLFAEGYGFGFVAPTVGVSNMVLPVTRKASVRVARACEAVAVADDLVEKVELAEGEEILFDSPAEHVDCVGLREFHCPECRARRHGTTVVSQYFK